jgi:hypothetical protein
MRRVRVKCFRNTRSNLRELLEAQTPRALRGALEAARGC